MAELSPAAQAVMIAATNGNTNVLNDPVYRQCIAAALHAAADQVVPEPPAWEIGVLASADREVEIRHEILAIAAELKGINS